jgi:hypothetical protein
MALRPRKEDRFPDAGSMLAALNALAPSLLAPSADRPPAAG